MKLIKQSILIVAALLSMGFDEFSKAYQEASQVVDKKTKKEKK
jgi:hypothetical protein